MGIAIGNDSADAVGLTSKHMGFKNIRVKLQKAQFKDSNNLRSPFAPLY
jgi:hypothetical protein